MQGDEAQSESDSGPHGGKDSSATKGREREKKEEQGHGGEKLHRPRFSPAVEAALSFAHGSVTIIAHENSCYDWGTFGWALKRPEANKRPYKFWLLVNSSVRGPFVHPASTSAAVAAAAAFSSSSSSPSSSLLTADPLFPIIPWHAILTSRLRGAVHAAGPVISCEPSPYRGQAPQGPWAVNPHVQSWAIALDAEALEVLRAASPRRADKNDNKGATKQDQHWQMQRRLSPSLLPLILSPPFL